MRRALVVVAACWAAASCAPPTAPQATRVDVDLAREIAAIRAIDNHAHPLRVVAAGEQDRDSDALPLDAMEPFPLPARLRPDNIEFLGAWRQLFAYAFDDFQEAHLKQLGEVQAKAVFMAAEEALLTRYLAEVGLTSRPATFQAYLDFISALLQKHKEQGAIAEKFEMAYLRTLAWGSSSTFIRAPGPAARSGWRAPIRCCSSRCSTIAA